MASLDEVLQVLTRIEEQLPTLVQKMQISPVQIVVGEGLSDISRRLGLIQAGEFRTGNGLEPGSGFSGVRIGYPAFTYASEAWNVAGVNNDVIQVGIRASDGKLIAGGGNVRVDADGIWIANNTASLNFSNLAGYGGNTFIYVNTNDDLGIFNFGDGKAVMMVVRNTDDTDQTVSWREDSVANRNVLEISDGAQGGRLLITGVADIDFYTQGDSGGSTYMRMMETTVTPTAPGFSNAFHLYMKSDKLIIQYLDGATVRYKYLDLTGTGVTWVHTTSAP